MVSQEPRVSLGDPRVLVDEYLEHYRDVVVRKLDGLSEEELRRSRVPSGWTPLGLLVHLTFVERRWLVWGFQAEPVDEPWGDRAPDGGWRVPEGWTGERARAEFAAQCARSRQIVAGVPAGQRAALGGRFATAAEAPTLGWILFHLLQEYARHAGHLDIARELADGAVGE
jgi:uncharacterized protein DUF664